MLSGQKPFWGTTPADLLVEMRAQPIQFHGPYWDTVSAPAKDFVRKCMVRDPSKRLTATQVLAHPWVRLHAFDSSHRHALTPGSTHVPDHTAFVRDRATVAHELVSSEEEDEPKTDTSPASSSSTS